MARQQTHHLASLDVTGTLAAIYPSEDQLWTSGPPINDPGDQGVAVAASSAEGGPVPPEPRSDRDLENTERYLHDVMNGETANAAYEEEWVNLQIGGIAGYGNYNEQPYYSGHSQVVQANPAAEQGWGVGPARRWAHYPFSELGNPTRNANVHMRNGQLPWVTADSSYYERTQLAWEQQWANYKQRIPVNPVVPVADSVPFTQTVPTYGGGQVPNAYVGVDVPAGAAGIYPDGSGIYG